MSSQLIEDEGTLLDVTELDVNEPDPGTMIYIDIDGVKEQIYLTTIIPGHHHGDTYHGIAVSGQFKPMKITAPKNTEITRVLKVGEQLRMGGATEMNVIGTITRIQVWSTRDNMPDS